MKLRKIEDDELDELIDNGDLATKKAIIKALREDDSAQIATGDGIVVVSSRPKRSRIGEVSLWFAYLATQIICITAQLMVVVGQFIYTHTSRLRSALAEQREKV